MPVDERTPAVGLRAPDAGRGGAPDPRGSGAPDPGGGGVPARPDDRPAPGGAGRSRILWLGPIILFTCFELAQLRVLFGYSRIATDEDQTLLWFAGRELSHFHLHEPSFYGQNYNTVFEALPGQLLHLLGVSLSLSGPLVAMLMASACWLVLAWAARRRGHRLAAAAALALPICLSVPYLLLFDAPRGVLSGDLAGAIAVAAAVAIRRPRLRLALVIAIGGLGIAWENAVALAVLPAFAAATAGDLRPLLVRPWRTLVAAGGAVLVPAAWLLADHLFYRAHPVDLTATTVNTKLSTAVLGTNLSHPGRLFSFYESALWPHPAGPMIVIAAVLILAIVVGARARRPEPIAAALTLLAVLLVTLSVTDTLDVHPDLYLSGSRFLLPLPIGLWVVLAFTLSTGGVGRSRRPGRPWQRARREHPGRPRGARWRPDARHLMAAIVLVATTSAIVAQIRFTADTRAVTAVDASAHPVIDVVNPDALLAQCATIATTYRRTGAQLLATNRRDVAYGCAAQSGLNTIDAEYDRRGWLLRADATEPTERILIEDRSCRSIPRQAGTCRRQPGSLVLLLTPRRPPSVSLALASLPLRGAPTSGAP